MALVNVITPSGRTISVEESEVPGLERQGYRREGAREAHAAGVERVAEERYGQGLANVRAGLEGAARGLTLGLSDVILASDAEGVRERQERNPVISTVSELAGAAAPAVVSGGAGALGAVARATPAGLVTGLGARLAARGAAGAIAGGAVEGAAFSAGHVLSESILKDRELTAESFLAGVGQGALWGGAAGGAFQLLSRGTRAARNQIEGAIARKRDVAAMEAAAKTAAKEAKAADRALERLKTQELRQENRVALEQLKQSGRVELVSARGEQALAREMAKAEANAIAARARADELAGALELEQARIGRTKAEMEGRLEIADVYRSGWRRAAESREAVAGVPRPDAGHPIEELIPKHLQTKSAVEVAKVQALNAADHAAAETDDLVRQADWMMEDNPMLERELRDARNRAASSAPALREWAEAEAAGVGAASADDILRAPGASMNDPTLLAPGGGPKLPKPSADEAKAMAAEYFKLKEGLEEILDDPAALAPVKSRMVEIAQRLGKPHDARLDWEHLRPKVREDLQAELDALGLHNRLAASGAPRRMSVTLLEGSPSLEVDGRMYMSRQMLDDATAFFDKRARGLPVSLEETTGGHHFLHESIHGYGSLTWPTFKAGGAVVEEVATETLARKLARERYGADLPLRLDIGDARVDRVTGVGSYQRTINGILDDLVDVGIRPDKAELALEMAAMKYKSTPHAATTPEEAVATFVEHLPGMTRANRKELIARWRDRDLRAGELAEEGSPVAQPGDVERAASAKPTAVRRTPGASVDDPTLIAPGRPGGADIVGEAEEAKHLLQQAMRPHVDDVTGAALDDAARGMDEAVAAQDEILTDTMTRRVEDMAGTDWRAQAAQEMDAAAAAGAGAPAARGRGLAGTALGVLDTAAQLGGLPDTSDIPVVGPLLSAYLKYRAVRAALGRAGFRVGGPVANLARTAARAQDRIVEAVGAIARGADRGVRAATPAAPGTASILSRPLWEPLIGQKDTKDPQELMRRREEELQRAVAEPARTQSEIAAAIPAPPALANAIAATSVAQLQYLASKIPPDGTSLAAGSKPAPRSPTEIRLFALAVQAVRDPLGALEAMRDGTINPVSVEAIKVAWPRLYQEAQRALIDRASTGEGIPYTQRNALGLVFDVPLDGTQMSEYRVSGQAEYAMQAQAAPPQPAPQTMRFSKNEELGAVRRAQR